MPVRMRKCSLKNPFGGNMAAAASHREAMELSPQIHCISVKDMEKGWEPAPEETYPIIYNRVLEALNDWQHKTAYQPDRASIRCELVLSEGYCFDAPDHFPWAGHFESQRACWETPDTGSALSQFWHVHNYIRKIR